MTVNITLTRGLVAVVDDDCEYLARYNWQAIAGWKNKTWYAKRDERNKCILMHREICGVADVDGRKIKVDHGDGNGLNNQRSNIQVVSASFNTFKNEGLKSTNTSGVTGVNWHSQRRKWCAELKYNGVKYSLGLYETIEEAAAARLKKEKEIWERFSDVL